MATPKDNQRIQLADRECFLVWRYASGGTVEVLDIAVSGLTRREGNGRLLLKFLFDILPAGTKVWAITRRSNHIARQFWEGVGFTICALLLDFYRTQGREDHEQDQAIMYSRYAGPNLHRQ